MKSTLLKPPHLFNSFILSFLHPLKPKTMKQFRIVAALLLLLGGISLDSLAQSPTIQREVRLVNPSGTTGYVGLKAGTSTTTYTLTLPSSVPALNQVLQIGTVSGTTATANWADLSTAVGSTAWLLTGNASTTASNYLGTSDAQPLSIRTSGAERLAITSAGAITLLGASTVSNTLNVNGATALGSTLDVTGATTLTGLLTANGGATVIGTTSLTGATSINTTGTALTTIGNTAAATGVIINTGSTGGLTLGNLQAGTISTSEILVLGTGNKVGKVSTSSLNSELYRARGVTAVSGANDSGNISVTDLAAADVIHVTLEGSGTDMPIPSFYVRRTTGSSGSFIIYFSAPFTGTYNYAVIKN